MLAALAPSSGRGGRGWHDAFASLPGGNIASPARWISSFPSRHDCVLQVSVHIRRLQKCGFPVMACSGPDFPSLSRQGPFFHIPTWISSQLLRERGRDPLKAMLKLPLRIGPRYILTHPRGCFQGDDSELSPPGTEGQGQARCLALCCSAWQCPGPAPAALPAPQGIPRWAETAWVSP